MKPEPAAPQRETVTEIGERQPPRPRQPSIEERRKLVSESLNVGNPANNASAANFGQITSAGSPRVIQLALKYSF